MKTKLINWFYYWIGIVFLFLAKARSIIQGYTPKDFSMSEIQQCVEYDIEVVDRWISHLQDYSMDDPLKTLINKRILELGPGSDLGVGLYILSKGAKEYISIDVYNLIEKVPDQFYNFFFTYLKEKKHIDPSYIIEELNKTKNGDNDKLNFIYRKDFDIISALGTSKVDIVFSNAAFEHFDNINETIKALSAVTVSGGMFNALIDLKTHSRWIREKDPINIYRYPEWLYGFFSVRGTPNRVRPYQYKEALEINGWNNITITAYSTLEDSRYNLVKDHLNKKFIDERNQMNFLTVWISARKK
jgi:hypothetical protein